MTQPSLTLSPAQFSEVFPFHFAVDEHLRLRQVGRSLARLIPNARPEAPLTDLFVLHRPERPLTFIDLRHSCGALVVLESLGLGVRFRGELLHHPADNTILFLGSPWLTHPREIQRLGLTLADFAIHDPVADLVQVIQAQRTAFSEIKSLADQLAAQRSELRLTNTTLAGQNAALTKVEKDLRLTTTRLYSLIENLQAGVLVEDAERRIVLANDAFCQLFRIPVAPVLLIGTDCAAAADQARMLFAHPEEFTPRVQAICAARRLVTNEELLMADGRWVERDYVPIIVEKDYLGHLWQYRDITSRKRADEALRAEKEHMATTLASIGDAVVSVDAEGRVVLMNTRAVELTGWPRDEGIGRPINEVLRLQTDDTSGPGDPVGDTLRNGRPWGDVHTLERIHLLHGRRDQPIEIVAAIAPIRDVSEGTAGAVLVFREVSRELEVERLKSNFAASVSHELRTPLTSMSGFLDTMVADPEMPADTRNSFLQIVRDQTRRLSAMVEEILEYSRLESGQTPLHRIPCDVASLTLAVITDLHALAESRGILLESEIASRQPTVSGDPDRLRSVLTNLIGNALKYTPASGRVVVTVASSPKGVSLSVSDTGPGIPPEDLPHIFKRFYRGRSAGSTTPGTGLGLAIAKQVVDLHGGSILARNLPEGGSCFEVRLPSGQAAPPTPHPL